MLASDNQYTQRRDVCRTVQGRGSPRFYSDRDAGRIALYAKRSGATTEEIYAEVTYRLGYTDFLCAFVRALNPVRALYGVLVKIGGAIAVQVLINILLQVLSGGVLQKLSKIRVFGIVFVVVLSSLEAIVEAIQEILLSIDTISAGLDSLAVVCILAESRKQTESR